MQQKIILINKQSMKDFKKYEIDCPYCCDYNGYYS